MEKKKKGRPKSIQTPEIMWSLFEEYKAETKKKPKNVHVFVGGMGRSAQQKKERPLTMEGFTNYLEDKGVITDVTDYFENKGGRYEDFVRVCSRIRREIRQDQIEGGLTGIYNPSITQRLNGIADKSIVEHVEQPLFPDEK